jgi:hypothetical protein
MPGRSGLTYVRRTLWYETPDTRRERTREDELLGRPESLVVPGEPGMGKSQLLRSRAETAGGPPAFLRGETARTLGSPVCPSNSVHTETLSVRLDNERGCAKVASSMREETAAVDSVGDMILLAEVAETGSFTQSGARVGMPKSTVSQRIAQLEERLGLRFLNRSTQHVGLTGSGQVYLDDCRRVRAEVSAASVAMANLKDQPVGALKITCP